MATCAGRKVAELHHAVFIHDGSFLIHQSVCTEAHGDGANNGPCGWTSSGLRPTRSGSAVAARTIWSKWLMVGCGVIATTRSIAVTVVNTRCWCGWLLETLRW